MQATDSVRSKLRTTPAACGGRRDAAHDARQRLAETLRRLLPPRPLNWRSRVLAADGKHPLHVLSEPNLRGKRWESEGAGRGRVEGGRRRASVGGWRKQRTVELHTNTGDHEKSTGAESNAPPGNDRTPETSRGSKDVRKYREDERKAAEDEGVCKDVVDEVKVCGNLSLLK